MADPKVQTLTLHAFIYLCLAILACIPSITQFLVTKTYDTHRRGVVVVTGCSTGIGRAAAIALSSHEGFTVYAGVRSSSDASAIDKLKIRNLQSIILDVTKSSTIDAAVKKVSSDLKRTNQAFTGIVNNAGIAATAPLETLDIDAMKKVFDVNTFGALLVTQKFLPLIRDHGSRIVFVSSIIARMSLPLWGGLAASKMALEGLADGLRRELAPWEVSVSSVQPGMIDTAALQATHDRSKGLVSDQTKETYAHLYTDAKAKTNKQAMEKADSPEGTVRAISHALCSTHPRTRYVVGGFGYLPSFLIAAIASYFPDRLQDAFLSVA